MHEASETVIRLIRADEFEAVGALTVDAYASAYQIELSDDYLADLARVAERAALHEVWVAVDGATGELLGTVTTPRPGERLSEFAAAGDMDFRMLAVAQSARGRGIGRLLVAHCQALAEDRGASRLVLHTGSDMHLAVALYESLGFERLVEIEENFPYPPGVWYPVRVYGKDLCCRGLGGAGSDAGAESLQHTREET